MNLTEPQAAFVLRFTSDPACIGNASAAARAAGYSERNAGEIGRQLLDKPHVRAAIDEAMRRQISGPMAAKASALLARVVDDETAPLKVRVEAAKTILDRAGIVPPTAFERAAEAVRKASDGKAIGEMTIEEIRTELAMTARIVTLNADEPAPLVIEADPSDA
ncbi:MAG TPA: terminase small subunit [Acetobacteraceae bacterium]|nr:terminase small subunit [Acetobacteraceae bacterium]